MQDAHVLGVLAIAYDLAACARDAMRRIARAMTRAVPDGPVAVAWFDRGAQLEPGAVQFERADQDYISRFFEWQRSIPIAVRQLQLASAPRVVGPPFAVDQLPAELEVMVRGVSPMCVMANTGDGAGIHILFGSPGVREWPPGQHHCLHDIAQHLAIAWRLRTSLGVSGPGSAASVDRDARAPAARDRLRSAVLASEEARPGDQAACDRDLWPAILAGRWSVLDAFAAAEIRYIVAYKNPTGGAMVRALTPRDRAVLELALGGHSGKWISLDLALCESTVARTLRTALRRVGVTDVADLGGVRNAVFAPIVGLVAGVDLAVARLTPAAARLYLSDAERAIVTGIVAGKRVAAIARERGTSPRTVSHQLSSVYRKLGVCSRREALALLA
jgi:DNA-binding NarL/FixJ family response regulator